MLLLLFNLVICPTFFFSRCLDRSFPPLSYLLHIRIHYSLKTSQILPAPHLLSRSPPLPVQSSIRLDVDVACTCHPPASAAHTCALRRVPASAAVPMPVCSTLCRPRPSPRSLSAPGGVLPPRFPLCLCVPALFSLSYPPNLGIVQFWCLCWVSFRER